MNNFKDIIGMTWFCAALGFLMTVVVCVFAPEFSKDELSLSLLGLVVSVLTLAALWSNGYE